MQDKMKILVNLVNGFSKEKQKKYHAEKNIIRNLKSMISKLENKFKELAKSPQERSTMEILLKELKAYQKELHDAAISAANMFTAEQNMFDWHMEKIGEYDYKVMAAEV